MISYKIHMILASIAIVYVALPSGQAFEDHSSDYDKPWFFDDLVQPGASQLTQNYYREGTYADSTDDSPSYSEPYYSSSSSTKTVPREDKSYKKPTYPYHAKSEEFKFLFKAGSPFCREVKSERTDGGSMVCYKCKDPKTGMNYEHCSKASKTRKPRIRRSHEERASSSSSSEEDEEGEEDRQGKDFTLPQEYRFSEEYFLPQASNKKPASYKDKSDKCEKVVKDSMVCMVCHNPRTNGKYKQCSYVHDPRDKAYEYSKSSSFSSQPTANKPVQVGRGRDETTHQAIRDASPESEEDSWEKERGPGRNYDEEREGGHGSSPTAAESSGCKKVQKDGQVCTVCKDPKTGGNSEKCYYEYQPSDKVYKFTRSKTFGFPSYSSPYDKKESDDSAEESESNPNKSSAKPDQSSSSYKDFGYGGSYEDDEPYKSSESKSDYEYNPVTSIYDNESEKIAQESKSADCKEVRKDSMICSVCKDPKTGGNSERCTYSYQPNDKLFSYSKKKSYGNPTEFKERADHGSEENSKGFDGSSTESSLDGFRYSETKPVANSVKNQTGYSAEWDPQPAHSSKVDLGYFDTSKRKAEIEKFLEEFQSEDRSKCQKVMRDKMTCYQCVDDAGFQKEECMYVTEPAAQDQPKKKVKREPAKGEVLEPVAAAAASYGTYVRVRRADGKNDDNDDEEEKAPQQEDELQEAEPYDTASETREKYDKVLGFSLPAYMIDTSDMEAEFDRTVASGY